MTNFDCPVESCNRSVKTENGLKSHIAQVHPNENPWNSEEWLRSQYVEKEKSLVEIADEYDCTASTLSRKLSEFGIKARSRGYANRVPYMPYQMGPYGRMHWRSTRGDGDGGKIAYGFEVHRLLAIAEYGVEAVAGNDVHHKNQIPWDNRPENIEVLSREEHGKLHSDKYYNND